MGLEEMIRLQERHKLMDFVDVKRRFDSSEKILMNQDGVLETNMQLDGISSLLEMDLVITDKQFDLRKQFTRTSYDLKKESNYDNGIVEKHYSPFTYALTGKQNLQMTLI